MQKLITDAIIRRTPRLYSTECQGVEAVAQARFFSQHGSLTGWEWFMTEYDPETGEAFGLKIGYFKELGYFSIKEFEEMNKKAGLNIIERDEDFMPCKLSKAFNYSKQ